MNITKLQKKDLKKLLGLYAFLHESDERPDFEAALKIWEESESTSVITYWGLFHKAALISSCQVTHVPNLTRGGRPYCFIENVVTHPSHRGKGYGKAVLAAALDYAWSINCYKAMLMTGRNESVQSFYKSAGFSGAEKHAFIANPGST